ncbi:MAG TPA: chromate efflux transporter [Anaerolineaceae bacterium]|nr:chromate efflux transporter [Anaerolineaceae bacterium]
MRTELVIGEIIITKENNHIKEVVLLFLKLGFTGFGGPAAHIGMMHDEVVKRRKWLDEQEFLDLIGATNLIPGPNSTEMAIHISFKRAGWLGLILGGLSFILPAMFIVLVLAWLYVQYGSYPQADWLLYGIKPVVIAIVFQALLSLGSKAIKDRLTAVMVVIVIILYWFGVNEIALLFGGGLVLLLLKNIKQTSFHKMAGLILPGSIISLIPQAISGVQLPLLFFTFLKIGSVLYGSGYVLLAFLRSDFVVKLGWLTDQQLIDAIAIGQVTPGPVFTTATFIGYVLADIPGALLATLGIFLPSFIFVALSSPLIPKLRKSKFFGGLLDGINAVSLGLMAAVLFQLSRSSLIDPITIVIGLVAAILLIRYRVNSTWLVVGGGVIGLLFSFL